MIDSLPLEHLSHMATDQRWRIFQAVIKRYQSLFWGGFSCPAQDDFYKVATSAVVAAGSA